MINGRVYISVDDVHGCYILTVCHQEYPFLVREALSFVREDRNRPVTRITNGHIILRVLIIKDL